MAVLTGTDAMEAAADRICEIMDRLRREDQFAVVKRLVTITAMKSEGEPEEYLEALQDVVMDDIAAHLAGVVSAPTQKQRFTPERIRRIP